MYWLIVKIITLPPPPTFWVNLEAPTNKMSPGPQTSQRPYCCIAKTQKGFTNISVKFLNSIPMAITMLPASTFKLEMKQFMCNNTNFEILNFMNT